MVRNRSKKVVEATVPAVTNSSDPVEMVISNTAEQPPAEQPAASTEAIPLVDKLNGHLSVLKELGQVVESTVPKDDKLMGSRFMKNRIRHQLEDLQRSIERFTVQMEREA